MKKPLKIAVAAAIANIGLLHSTGVMAGGTSFTEQGASGLGNSYAGLSSAAEDASVLYWNPAALTRFKRAELVGGVLLAQIASPYTNSNNPPCEDATFTQNDKASQQAASRGTAGQPQGCTRSGVPGKVYERSEPARVIIPFNFAAIPLNDRMVMGLGASGSSGLIVRFPSDSPGRTQAESTDLKVIRLSGGLGYKLTPTISIGGSVGYERMFESIRARLSFKTAVSRQLANQGGGNQLSTQIGNIGAGQATPDVPETSLLIRVFGYAYNGQVGALWEPSEKTRVGFGYRPKTTFNNAGALEIQQIPTNLQGQAGQQLAGDQAVLLRNDQTVTQKITLPSELNLSVFHSFTPKTDLMASWLREDFTSTRVDFRTADGTVVQNPRQNFQITNRYAIGMNYKYAPRLTLRAGFAKENSAIKDEDRLQSLPDNDRTFYNVGARWKIDRSMNLDVGYQRIQFKEGVVGLNPQPTDVVYNGKIKLQADIIGIQLVDQF